MQKIASRVEQELNNTTKNGFLCYDYMCNTIKETLNMNDYDFRKMQYEHYKKTGKDMPYGHIKNIYNECCDYEYKQEYNVID